MLITFECEAHENITMFGEVAVKLLKMMGHSGTVPSAMLPDDIPEALANLKKSLAKAKDEPQTFMDAETDDDTEISLANRAYPLIKMLKNAEKEQCSIMWKERT